MEMTGCRVGGKFAKNSRYRLWIWARDIGVRG
jgi:hypothetical protein